MKLSEITLELRAALDAAGIDWDTADEEFSYATADRAVYHMERTRVLDGKGSLRASVIWGYSGPRGCETGSTKGWPEMVEVESIWYLGTPEPMPMPADCIVPMIRRTGPTEWDGVKVAG